MISRRSALIHGSAAIALAGGAGPGFAQDRYDQQHLLDFAPVGTVTVLHVGDLFGQRHPHLMRPSGDKLARAGDRHLPEHQTGELLRIRFGVGGRQPMDYALTHAHFEEDAAVYGPMGGVAHVATVLAAIRARRTGSVLIAGEGMEPLSPLPITAPLQRLSLQDVPVAVLDLSDIAALPDQIAQAKAEGRVVLCRSAMGIAADRAIAAQVPGIDLILCQGDAPAFPEPIKVDGTTIISSGTQGRFVSRIDLEVEAGQIVRMAHRLIPVFADLLDPTPVEGVGPPETAVIGQAQRLLYRRGSLGSTWDALLCAAMRAATGAQVALVPGLQHGVSLLPGQPIHRADVQSVLWGQPERMQISEMTGAQIIARLEGAANAVFDPDPLSRRATAMMRAGGITFNLDPDGEEGARVSAARFADGGAVEAEAAYTLATWGLDVSGRAGPTMIEAVTAHLSVNHSVTPD